MFGKTMAFVLAVGIVAGGILAGGGANFSPVAAKETAPQPPVVAPALAQLPEPLYRALPAQPAARPRAAAPQSPAPAGDKVDALVRALFMITSGGTGRPYPLIPQD